MWVLAAVALTAWAAAARGQQVNRAPQFLPGGDMARFQLREDTPVGAPVYQLRGSDPEGSRVHYSISGDYLAVDRDSGVVSLRAPLDREAADLIEVIISITDEGLSGGEPNTISLRRELPVLDVNDNAPVFLGRPYAFTVSETAAVGQVLYSNISITDADGGTNADVQLTCLPQTDTQDACETFAINSEKVAEGSYVGTISLLRPLDYERRSAYSLVLLAVDQARDYSVRLSATANVAIDVMDVQDQPPVFLNAPFSATVPEATPQGTSVLNIKAKDGDLGNPRPILLTIEGDDLGYFQLEMQKNEKGMTVADLVTSDNPLDREHPDIIQSGGIYTFAIRAIELINNELPGDSSVSQVTIVVTDVDDQVPQFNQHHFYLNVSEDIGSDTPLPGLNMVVHDKDVGENARYSLKLRDVQNSAGIFTVHPSSALGRTPVVVRVTDSNRLDYDVADPSLRRIIFDVVASVSRNEGSDVEAERSRVTIDLVDANDNSPVFSQADYRVRVAENVPPGTFIRNVSATDRDSGKFGQITYSIKGFGAETFSTHPTLGGLYLANSSQGLDYESQKSYSLTFEARDGGGRVSTVNLFVDVDDVNDNAPVFELPEYHRIVREGSTTFEPQLFVRATDVDGPEQGGGKIFYSLQSSNAEGVFFVEPISGEVKFNLPARAGDTLRGQYEIRIKATDAGLPPLSSEARVNVRVGVPGNQRPVFQGNLNSGMGPAVYSANVPENAPSGTDVIQVMATDPDGQDSQLQFFIASGARDNFAIHQKSGKITVSPDAHLDLETSGDNYKIIVHAVDSGTPIRETATATVLIEVTDINNKPPVFPTNDPSAYVRYVSERVPVGNVIMTIAAKDPDADAKLEYSIVEPIKASDRTGVALQSTVPYNYKEAFRINSTTGEVYVAKPLDHTAAAGIIFTVQAKDLNAVDNVDSQFARVEVTVYIQAYSDTNPLFTIGGWTPTNPHIRIVVPEEQPVGTTLLMLSARDPVSGRPITRFEEVKGAGLTDADDFISIGLTSGNILLNKRLDYETLKQKILSFQVRAISENDRSSEATVTIEVEDINDNSPEFTQRSYTANVPESAVYPDQILTVEAKDLDANSNDTGYGTIVYSIIGESANFFSIDSLSGVIQVAPNVMLDREKQSVLRITVVAADTPQGGVNQRKATATVTINVLDVNDNPPSFNRKLYSAVVPENVAVGTQVTVLSSVDPDEGDGGKVKYEILDEGEANGLFYINETTGVIKTKHALTGKGRNDPYMLTVRAQDLGTPPLSSDVTLSIYIGDVFANDGVPLFIRPTLNEVAYISENSSVGSPVFQVIASDPDDPNSPNGRITYRFLDAGGDMLPFRINPESGLVTTRKLLDREVRENYSLLLVVQDGGDPPQQATRELKVTVLDIDDHAPMFRRTLDEDPQFMTVKEELDIGTEVGHIEAVDEDSGENAMIDYLITYGNEEGLFEINRTDDNKGLITVAKRLDREAASEHVLTVKCFKRSLRPPSLRKQYNRQDPSEMQVRIKVEDIDDNKPVFLQDNITIGVRLNVPVDTSLLYVEAKDADAEALPINYHLVNTTFFSLAPSVIDTVSMPADHNATFRLDEVTGELRTAGSMQAFVDGYFELIIIADNSIEPNREANATVKIFVVRDRDLLRFVFNKPPTDVRRLLPEFRREVEKALLLPVSLNVYDTQLYAKEDGSLDFSSTSSCFQLVGRESYDLSDMKSLLQDDNNADLNRIYDQYGVQAVQHCAPIIARAEASWIQLFVLAIACFIGLAALIAGITTCCLYSRYKHQLKRSVLQNNPRLTIPSLGYISGTPSMVLAPSSGMSDGPRMYECSTLPPGHDNISYHSFPAR